MKQYRIAYIPGDGIGKETGPEGLRVLEAAARKFGFALKFDEYDWSCDYYQKHGRMMPEDGLDQVRQHDAIFFGAAGWPATVPDHISLWGLLIPFRRNFDQYVNLRPVRLMPGVKCPLADRKVGDIDFWVVRENSEGEYSSIGGRMYGGTENEFATQQAVFSRRGTDRIMKFAFELARKGKRKHVTSATKSNGISISMPYWDERFKAMSRTMPRRAVCAGFSVVMSMPLKLMLPLLGCKNLVSRLKKVVLPAPLGPISAWMWPRRTFRSTWLTATNPLNSLVSPRVSSMNSADKWISGHKGK